jgi:hypothetical protein
MNFFKKVFALLIGMLVSMTAGATTCVNKDNTTQVSFSTGHGWAWVEVNGKPSFEGVLHIEGLFGDLGLRVIWVGDDDSTKFTYISKSTGSGDSGIGILKFKDQSTDYYDCKN